MAWPIFTAPWMLAGAAVGALVIGVLHLLSVRQPSVLELPTARFVPEGEARAVARQPRPNDLLLLLLRVLAVLLAGLAFAGMQWPTTRATVLRLVVLDSIAARDSLFTDSLSRTLRADSVMVALVAAPAVRHDPGTSLVVATAEATRLVQQHATLQRVELTTQVPHDATSWRGFVAWREQWPGAVQILTRGAVEHTGSVRPRSLVRVYATKTTVDDPVSAWSHGARAALQANGPANDSAPVVDILRAPREELGATADGASVVVHWPVAGIPDGWEARTQPDTVGAVMANGEVLAGPWVRVARVGAELQARLDSGTTTFGAWRVIAWWSDGEPAVVEQQGEDGCARTVSLVVLRGSDVLLSPAAQGVREAITGPCGGARASWALVRGELDSARTQPIGPDSAAPAAAFRTAAGVRSGSDPRWLAPLLLGLAMIALLAEWVVRQREGRA